MLLSRQAFELLLAPRGPMKCKSPGFPEIVLTLSECGTYKYFKCEKFFTVVFLETCTRDPMMVSGFRHGLLSNFSDCRFVCMIDGKEVVFDCGEKAFKAACAIFHLSPNSQMDGSSNEKNLKVLEKVLNAETPKDVKNAVYGPDGIEGFRSKEWDDVSPDVMYQVQLLKFKNVDFRDFGLKLAQIAKDHGVKPNMLFITEAVGGDNPTDRIWGTGPGADIDELFELICKEGNSVKLYKNLADPKKTRAAEDAVFVGFNCLGKAIEKALQDLIGIDFQGLSETMEEFVTRINLFNGFDLFEVAMGEPEAKRSRSVSSTEDEGHDDPDAASSTGLCRTLSH